MTQADYPNGWPELNTVTYNRSVRLFRTVKNMLGVKIQLHADSQPEQGDIFLFNHFSRFETFIPQFLIHEKTGAYSCSIASSEFFEEDTLLSRYLKLVGVYPHDHPRLFQLLAVQILRGRKVIVFPEGGMVKDRRVMDRRGHYNVFSRITGERRKQHTGAAVLAQGLEVFKNAIRKAYRDKNRRQLLHWKEELQIDSLDTLLMTALKPTLIVPANITFYPIRSSANLLEKAVELFSDSLTSRQMEELLVEGNILLKDTDMDIRMGSPIAPCTPWQHWYRFAVELIASEPSSLNQIFALHSAPSSLKQRLLRQLFRRCIDATRDRYVIEIYANVTINLSHLASSLIMDCLARNHHHIEKKRFYTALYLATRQLQNDTSVHLHSSLMDPDEYIDLIDGESTRFKNFIGMAQGEGLLADEAEHYRFMETLRADYGLDTIRLENLIAVYSNEVAPIGAVRKTLDDVCHRMDDLDQRQLASSRFEDELRSLAWERKRYSNSRFHEINSKETVDADPTPFFFQPTQSNGMGVVLIHGLLAGPTEVRNYGRHLQEQGYTVFGVRLKGHGTSPHALREQSWEAWYGCVRRGVRILNAYCDHIILVGFSTGGALALKLAAESSPEIVAVVALSVPLKIINPAFALVPLLYETNRLVEWVSSNEGVMPFIENTPEHPHINYRHTPVRSLFELRRLLESLEESLPRIAIPTLVVYADADPIISAQSASELMDKLGSAAKRLAVVPASRHGILLENLGGVWEIIDGFLAEIRSGIAVHEENHGQ